MRDDRQCDTDKVHQIAALIIQGSRGYHGVIRNLSAKGVMFEGACTLVQGERVAVEIPGMGWAHATVAWALTPRSGISFDEPLPEDKIELLRAQLTLSIVRGDFPLIDEEAATETAPRPDPSGGGPVGGDPTVGVIEIDIERYWDGKPPLGSTIRERMGPGRLLEAL